MRYVLVAVLLAISLIGLLGKPWRRFLVVAPLLVVVAGIQFYLQHQVDRASKYASETGVLTPRATKPRQYPVLALCDSFLTIEVPNGTAFDLGGGDHIAAHLVDGKIKISFVIRDSAGIVRATVSNNVWFVPKNPNFVLDRNFDDSALEIIGSTGKPILQLELDGSIARLALATHTPGGAPRSFGPLLTNCGAGSSGGTLFKYPSSRYPGIRRVKINRPRMQPE